MSLNHATLAPSLPPFAQAFANLNSTNALPPIHTHSDQMDKSSPLLPSRSRPPSAEHPPSSNAPRKRSHDDITSGAQSPGSSQHSPRLDDIKEEQEQDKARKQQPVPLNPTDASSSTAPTSPLKKRRVTVSGSAPTASNPISPVVMAFPPPDQLRSSSSVKQKQKPLIDQHNRANGMSNPVSVPSSDDRLTATSSMSSAAPPSRSLRRSPNTVSSIRRQNPNLPGSGTRPSSPNPIQPPLSIAARRRAAQPGAGKKPADLLISPRDANRPDQRLLVQSAPPIPDRGQSAFYIERAPIALPRVPSIFKSADNIRRVASNVPPTPTRLSMQPRAPSSTIHHPQPGISGRSPPAASIPIATTLVPPTPSSLHHPGYTGDKAAFLAPFEMFYTALNDSKELKKWLSEQLQKSNSLMQGLAQQQDKMNEMVESLVERKVASMRSEINGLQRRVEELEALQQANRSSSDWERHHRNGLADSHAFPSAESSRLKADSARMGPSWAQERDLRENQEAGESEAGSPAFRGTTHSTDSSSYTRSNHHLHSHAKSSRSHNTDRVAGRSPSLTNLTTADRNNTSPRPS